MNRSRYSNLTVCVIPRSKSENYYSDDQRLFKKVISNVVDSINGLTNGTDYIISHTNTRTTHMNKSGYGGGGEQLDYQLFILTLTDFWIHYLKMKYTDNSLNIYTALSYKGIGKAWIVKNLKGNERVETIVQLLNKTIKEDPTDVDDFESRKNDFESKFLQNLEGCCDGFVALGDKKFPQHRGNVKDSQRPVFLFYKGNIGLLNIDNRNITVIGLLNPEGDIEEREREIVHQFVKNGATIVSGLAFGCDSIAHHQALESNGKTIAILPSPLNNILPTRNKGLAFQIVDESGLIVTEYGEDFKSQLELNSRYGERDRLQALFCDAILLTASYAQNSADRWKLQDQKLDSGSRLAMGYARDFNIPRTVMYDKDKDVNNPRFDLNRDIINEGENVRIITKSNFKDEITMLMKLKNEPFEMKSSINQTNLFGQ